MIKVLGDVNTIDLRLALANTPWKVQLLRAGAFARSANPPVVLKPALQKADDSWYTPEEAAAALGEIVRNVLPEYGLKAEGETGFQEFANLDLADPASCCGTIICSDFPRVVWGRPEVPDKGKLWVVNESTPDFNGLSAVFRTLPDAMQYVARKYRAAYQYCKDTAAHFCVEPPCEAGANIEAEGESWDWQIELVS